MRITSWNRLRRVGATASDVATLIRLMQPDLLLMQEATRDIADLPSLVGGTLHHRLRPNRVHGLAAWSPDPLPEPEYMPLPFDPGVVSSGRRFAMVLPLPALTVVNVHLSHGQRLLRRHRGLQRGWPDAGGRLAGCWAAAPHAPCQRCAAGPARPLPRPRSRCHQRQRPGLPPWRVRPPSDLDRSGGAPRGGLKGRRIRQGHRSCAGAVQGGRPYHVPPCQAAGGAHGADRHRVAPRPVRPLLRR